MRALGPAPRGRGARASVSAHADSVNAPARLPRPPVAGVGFSPRRCARERPVGEVGRDAAVDAGVRRGGPGHRSGHLQHAAVARQGRSASPPAATGRRPPLAADLARPDSGRPHRHRGIAHDRRDACRRHPGHQASQHLRPHGLRRPHPGPHRARVRDAGEHAATQRFHLREPGARRRVGRRAF